MENVNFVPCVCFVKRGVAKANPEKVQLTKEELADIINKAKEGITDHDQDSEDSENETKTDENKIEETPDANMEQDEFKMEDYDKDEELPSSVLGIGSIALIGDEETESYFTRRDRNGTEEDSDSEAEDDIIKQDDNLILVGHVEGDASILEVYVYNENEGSLYVHHDLFLPTFPLCIEWMDYDPSNPNPGNLCAIGTMDPVIEIWDLDIIDCLEPAFKLGNKKKKLGHKDAILDVAWNKNYQLKRHMVSHRKKCVSCDICGDQFPDGRSLMSHRHSHSSVSGRQFPCRECGKTFGSRSSQQIHIRIHTGERPYGCRFCWKAFADGGTLRKHERIHTGEKPYACAVCPRAFNQRVVLREHIRSHHSGPDTALHYLCSVCDETFSGSQDLVQHLIGHSDQNTALKRQPQVGPRKYKRRRKLKPYEVDRLVRRSEIRREKRSEEERESDVWYSDNSPVLDDDLVVVSNNSTKKQKPVKSTENNEGYLAVCDSFETVMQSFSSLVKDMKADKNKNKKKTVASKSRPKMIHTAKTRVEQKGSCKKTKTLITRSTVSNERNRPRTKNVNYHVSDKLPPAVFPDVEDVVRVKSESVFDSPLKDIKGIEKFNSDLVHDLEQILQSPIRPKNQEGNKRIFKAKKVELEKKDFVKEIIVKEEIVEQDLDFKCEMCSETFATRAELVVHIPVHI